MGALVIHVGAKAAATRAALRRGAVAPGPPPGDRRAFLAGVAAASGVLVVATAGGTVPALSPLSVLAQRRPGQGPQGLPVNKTAAAADVVDAALDPGYRLVISGPGGDQTALSLADLRALPQHGARLPIACVEGWSASASWRGVRVRDLLDLVGAAGADRVVVESLQRSGRYRVSELRGPEVRDRDTLLALDLSGDPLDLDHGFPVRLIGPGRPGVLQTKWVTRLVVP
jgi:DMSO/TMAO reductase YedYZ molybdopterin-dependent catalytic subunit